MNEPILCLACKFDHDMHADLSQIECRYSSCALKSLYCHLPSVTTLSAELTFCCLADL